MRTYVLTDVSENRWLANFEIGASNFETHRDAVATWSVSKTVLHGGRREGVDHIEVNNGALRMAILPTRGMGLWKGDYKGLSLGWESPIKDGPVNPAFVNLASEGGIGWLNGFDELLARCGLESNGAPHGNYTLHGKIANIPASYVAVHVDEDPPFAITIEGHVDEVRLFGLQVRMVTKISTTPGSNVLTVRDEFINLKDQEIGIQALYHWNFGAPFLGEGSKLVAPYKVITPRDAKAQAGLSRHDVYDAATPGFVEECFFYELHSRATDGNQTAVLLRDQRAVKGIVLRYNTAQLPAFTLWKNTGGVKDGYVTGLEPGTNYPNPRPFEESRGRVARIAPGASHLVETVLEVVDTKERVSAVEAEIAILQTLGLPVVNAAPAEPYVPQA